MKNILKLFALFLMSVFYTSCGRNQTNVPKDYIKSETKDIVTSYLPKTAARNIKKGRNGTILIAALFAGVFRYDGKSFRNFTTKDGLPNNDITTIIEDKTGKLWFGTRGDACFYDGNKFTVFRNKDGKAFNNVWSIIEDRKGNIWFGADGLWRYDGSTFTKLTQRGCLCYD
jgi:ligand-binding sensor domain-containing protein